MNNGMALVIRNAPINPGELPHETYLVCAALGGHEFRTPDLEQGICFGDIFCVIMQMHKSFKISAVILDYP